MIFHSRSSGRSFTEILALTNCISYWFASSESYLNAFKGDFKLEWILEVAWVVQDNNITYVDLSGARKFEQNKNGHLPWPWPQVGPRLCAGPLKVRIHVPADSG